MGTGGSSITLEIGGVATRLYVSDPALHRALHQRYSGFVSPAVPPQCTLDLHVSAPNGNYDDDLAVTRAGECWQMKRGDFAAEWRSDSGAGWVRQAQSPFATDSVIRILHTLMLARTGGFLLHAASAVIDGEAYIFTGHSGAGKTTMCRLAPSNATLLTDEISYIRFVDGGCRAYGTPFAGELGKAGENVSAPIRAAYVLKHGRADRITPLVGPEAIRELMRNILFFAHDSEAVRLVFQHACRFVHEVPMRRLEFLPRPQVWNLIA